MSCRIVSGGKGAGKTTMMQSLASLSAHPQGFVSLHRGDSYILLNLQSGEEELLMTLNPSCSSCIGQWYFDQSVFTRACAELESISYGDVFIDEIGRLELSGGGFAPALRALLKREEVNLTISVRDEYADQVRSSFSIEDAAIIMAEA